MKYIEIAVLDDFDDEQHTILEALDCAESVSRASPVGRHELEVLLIETRGDIRARYRVKGTKDDIDKKALAWPALATTYRRICALLNRLGEEP